MTNPAIAELIARKLQEGMVHPGDPKHGVQPKPIALPFGKTAGMPQQMSNLMDATVKLLSEAIVDLIETEGGCELVARDEVRSLRLAAGQAPKSDPVTPVFCRCGDAEPLMLLTINDPERVVIDGPALLSGLRNRAVDCPHEWRGI